ncbi:unnamed protein product [Nezara viridula]|uniref:Uncharacterized protein n=1 Tax=Nezara viridula TaxID=85310 RepID=A0A9P0HI29_NEZVI|nr:unnamed protein product [Nezara viridula]
MGRIFSSKCQSQKRLDGQVAIVTGCNTGIGKYTALDLAKRGAHVVMACRSIERAEAAAKDICSIVPKAELEIMKLDLSSLESVREFCKEFSSSHKTLHLLINNAGVLMNSHSVTVDGFETHFGTNHLGHFLLTMLLLPILIQSGPSRIINVSSLGHTYCDSLFFDDINMEKNYDPWTAYGRSKLANILFTLELAKRLEGTEVKTVSLHPGVVYTEISRDLVTSKAFSFIWFVGLLQKFGSWFLKTPEQGAQTTLFCALDDSIQSGLYYE